MKVERVRSGQAGVGGKGRGNENSRTVRAISHYEHCCAEVLVVELVLNTSVVSDLHS